MICPPNVTTCIDVQINAVIPDQYRDARHVEHIPVCVGEWRPLPYPTPPGSFGVIFVAKVTEDAPKDATVTVMDGQRVLGVVHFGETLSWECREDAHPERIA